jgi:hypothetical protein
MSAFTNISSSSDRIVSREQSDAEQDIATGDGKNDAAAVKPKDVDEDTVPIQLKGADEAVVHAMMVKVEGDKDTVPIKLKHADEEADRRSDTAKQGNPAEEDACIESKDGGEDDGPSHAVKQADVKQADVKQADVKQADVKQADVNKADFNKADFNKADVDEDGEDSSQDVGMCSHCYYYMGLGDKK